LSAVENQKKEAIEQKTEKHENSAKKVSTTIDTNDILFRLALRKEKIKQIREKRSKLLSKL
jgi:hypothetical protein